LLPAHLRRLPRRDHGTAERADRDARLPRARGGRSVLVVRGPPGGPPPRAPGGGPRFRGSAARAGAPPRPLDAIAGAVNPRARCHPVANPKDARFAWDVVIDVSAAPQEEPPELKLARL